MNATPNPAKLRDAIAETMWACVSAHDLEHVCDALGMPPGPEGANPWDSKRRYVRNRLIALSSAEVGDMARAVAEQYEDAELAALIGPAGVHGVDGELKNLIFAAHGPKPRIVLRDAINNVIEIVELADPDATPSDVSELQLRFIIEKVMALRHTPLDHEAFERAMVATTPVLAHPKVTDAAEDLGHLTRQPEWQRFWCDWTVQCRRADAQRIVEGVKAVMATMAVPGYTSNADSAWQLLRKTPELLGHFEALSAACGREFQLPSYQSAMRHVGPAPGLAPHLPRLTDDVEALAQRATIEILKALREEFGYTEVGRRWLADGTLVPGWAPQKGPKRGVMPEGLTARPSASGTSRRTSAGRAPTPSSASTPPTWASAPTRTARAPRTPNPTCRSCSSCGPSCTTTASPSASPATRRGTRTSGAGCWRLTTTCTRSSAGTTRRAATAATARATAATRASRSPRAPPRPRT